MTTPQGVGAPSPLQQKQLMTIEQVRETMNDRRYRVIQVENDDGTPTEVAFVSPKVPAYKRFMAEKDQSPDGVNAILNLLGSCCLTHSRKELEAIVDDGHIGFMATASKEVVDLMSDGVSVQKKG